MTAIMSFSNAPDIETLGRVAGALGVDEAFVEKDWFVVQAIQVLVGIGDEELTPVFSGGTSLLKGHQLIKRFSEDIDFKLTLSEAFLNKSQGQKKKHLSNFKKALVSAWEKIGFSNLTIEAGSGNAFIRIEMDYPSVLELHDSLRPHILAELSAKSPSLEPHDCSLISFVAQFQGNPPEVISIPCVDPIETAADKLSAFTWRVLVRDRGKEKDDPTIIRHVHDLAALEAKIEKTGPFGALLAEILSADSKRGGGSFEDMPLEERLAAMVTKLESDGEYEKEYARFVGAMAFGATNNVPTFDQALSALRRLSSLVPRTTNH